MGGLILSVEGLKRKILRSQEDREFSLQPAFGLKTVTSTLPRISSLLTCSVNFRLAKSNQAEGNFLKINSVLVLFLWRTVIYGTIRRSHEHASNTMLHVDSLPKAGEPACNYQSMSSLPPVGTVFMLKKRGPTVSAGNM